MTYTELYSKLIQYGLLESVNILPIRPSYPRWYKENTSCDYHSGNRGHSLEDCTALKWRVNDFINRRELIFEDEDVPNVNENPLPNHWWPKVNVVESTQEMQVKRDVRDVCMLMVLVYEALVKAGRLKGGQKKKEEMDQEKYFWQYHERTIDHFIQECLEFLELIQEIINEGEIEFYGKMEEQNVSVLLKEVPKPVTIFYRGWGQQVTKETSHVPTPSWLWKYQVRFAMQVIRQYHGIVRVKR